MHIIKFVQGVVLIRLARTVTIAIVYLQFRSHATGTSNEASRVLELQQVLGKMNSSAKSVTLPMKLRFFGFGVLYGLRVFPNLVFHFRFLTTLMAVFWIFLSNAGTILLVSPRKLHPAVTLKR